MSSIGYQKTLLPLKKSACLKLLFDTMDLVSQGGTIIIPRTTYRYLSYERPGRGGTDAGEGAHGGGPCDGKHRKGDGNQ